MFLLPGKCWLNQPASDEVLPINTPDEEVFACARSNGMVLLTCNRDDFLAFAENVLHPGIIIVVRRHSRALECAAVLRLLAKAGVTGITNNLNFA